MGFAADICVGSMRRVKRAWGGFMVGGEDENPWLFFIHSSHYLC